MKSVIFIVVSLLLSVNISAQSDANHMTFKGIPIDGSLGDFTSKMKQKGFTSVATEDGSAFFTGEFAAYNECIIIVRSSKSSNVVNSVIVSFPSYETWSKLYSNYSQLKSMLTQKYGKPKDCVEKFECYSEPRDDTSRMYAVEMDRCKYWTRWETKNGNIELKIEHYGMASCSVALAYFDKINTEKVNKSAIDDL